MLLMSSIRLHRVLLNTFNVPLQPGLAMCKFFVKCDSSLACKMKFIVCIFVYYYKVEVFMQFFVCQ